MKTKIYALLHPTTQEIRYIGKTTKNLSERLREHIYSGKKKKKNYKESWISNVSKNNLKPEIVLIDEVENSEWEFWEKYWICQFKCWGFDLVNGTDGGISPFETFRIIEKNKRENSRKKSKKVIQYDLNGNFIKIHESATMAGNDNKSLRRHIGSCCTGKRVSAGGFMWKFYTENFEYKINKYEVTYNYSGLEKGREIAKQFSKSEVKFIRNKYINKEMKLKELSKKFKVSIVSISNIINKKTYKDYE